MSCLFHGSFSLAEKIGKRMLSIYTNFDWLQTKCIEPARDQNDVTFSTLTAKIIGGK
jgi:hypothetical protein